MEPSPWGGGPRWRRRTGRAPHPEASRRSARWSPAPPRSGRRRAASPSPRSPLSPQRPRGRPGGTTKRTTAASLSRAASEPASSRPASVPSRRERSLRPSSATRTREPPSRSLAPSALPIAPGETIPTTGRFAVTGASLRRRPCILAVWTASWRWGPRAASTSSASSAITASSASFPQFEAVELRFGPDFEGVDPHVHADFVDAFYVLAGDAEFLVGDDTFRAEAGSFVAAPPGVRHGFRNAGDTELRPYSTSTHRTSASPRVSATAEAVRRAREDSNLRPADRSWRPQPRFVRPVVPGAWIRVFADLLAASCWQRGGAKEGHRESSRRFTGSKSPRRCCASRTEVGDRLVADGSGASRV